MCAHIKGEGRKLKKKQLQVKIKQTNEQKKTNLDPHMEKKLKKKKMNPLSAIQMMHKIAKTKQNKTKTNQKKTLT